MATNEYRYTMQKEFRNLLKIEKAENKKIGNQTPQLYIPLICPSEELFIPSCKSS